MQKKWILREKISSPIDEKLIKYPKIIRQLLFSRGIKTSTEAEAFLREDNLKFNDPFLLYKIEETAGKILDCIKNKQKIYIHGDYDVDGICATSILWDFLYRQLSADVMPFIPSRFEQGYGMTEESLLKIYKDGGRVVITVDCGIKDKELVEKWTKKGLKIFVTDHHELRIEDGKVILPEKASGIIHPAHPKSKYPFTQICGAAVSWKLVQVLNKLSKLNFPTDDYIDLVSLATVCDIMPLIDENRSIVKTGLEKLKVTKRKGLLRLMSDAGIEKSEIDVYHIGFLIGPRLNAAGRIDHALDAVRLMVTDSYEQARMISEKLQNLNTQRQNIQKSIYEQALEQIEIIGVEKKLYFVWGKDWQEGVVGIVAGKLSEKFNRPVLIASQKNGKIVGSARSIKNFNIVEAIATQSHLLERFGGHPQAAGFSLDPANAENFRDNLVELADKTLSDEKLIIEYDADAQLELDKIDWELVSWIDKFRPFGFGNPSIKFILKDVVPVEVSRVGAEGKHLKLTFFCKQNSQYYSSIAFTLAEEHPNLNEKSNIDVLFSVEINVWNGSKRLQLNIKDIHERQNSKSKI